MAKPITAERLRKWAQELDDEEAAEVAAADRAKLEQLADEDRLTADEVAFLRRVKADLEADDETDEKPEPEAEPEPDEKPEPEAEKTPRRRTRPGRKNGAAYGWWVDDDGNVVKIDGARIYSGDDEPDEVELPEPAEKGPEAA
jgi:hypothetical protein